MPPWFHAPCAQNPPRCPPFALMPGFPPVPQDSAPGPDGQGKEAHRGSRAEEGVGGHCSWKSAARPRAGTDFGPGLGDGALGSDTSEVEAAVGPAVAGSRNRFPIVGWQGGSASQGLHRCNGAAESPLGFLFHVHCRPQTRCGTHGGCHLRNNPTAKGLGELQ